MPPEGSQQPGERAEANDAQPAIARTNKVAKWSLASSFLGLAMILPVAGSVLGILGGKKAVRQIDVTGEGGGGIAEAAIVFGWFGLISSSLGVIGIVAIVVAAARS